MPTYGPYHRRQTPRTQTLQIGARQVLSGEAWGRPPTMPGFAPVPTVNAWPGPLPASARGIEFFTDVEPSALRPFVRWQEGAPGVRAVTGETDTVSIPVTVVFICQDRGTTRRAVTGGSVQ